MKPSVGGPVDQENSDSQLAECGALAVAIKKSDIPHPHAGL